MNKVKIALLALFASFSTQVVKAEEVTEGFEDVTIVDANGDAVSGNYTAGVGLSNGWMVVGGGICYASDYAQYGMWTTANSGSKSLTAQYSATNTAIMVIPVQMTGKLSFYARKTSTSSSSKGYVDLWEMEPDGTSFKKKGSSSFKYYTLTTTWTKYEYDLGSDVKYIGICLSRAGLDDVVYNTISSDPHTHDYATAWSSDAEGHWHACTSETGYCDTPKSDVAAHDGAVCSVCGYEVAGIKAFPWTENFNGVASGIPEGWDNSEGTVTTDSYKWNVVSYGGHEGKCMKFDSYNNKSGLTNILATPYLFIPETGEYELDFWYKNPKGGDFCVKVAEYGSAERTTLAEGLTDKADWTELKVNLAAYAGKIVKLYFIGTSNWGSGDAYLYLDDVTVKESIKHNHEYADAWSHNNASHWHACLSEVGECDAPQLDLAAHSFDANDVCTVCGFDKPFMEDFEHGIPATWTNNGFEVASNPSYGNGTTMAYAGRYSSSNTLVSPRLIAKAGDVIEMEALLPWDDETLTMEYSVDEGETWNVAFAETPAANNTLCNLSWTAPVDGYYFLRFSGRYNYIDNVCGFKMGPVVDLRAQGKEGDYYATFSAAEDVVFDNDVTVYTVSVLDDEPVLVLTEVENHFVPANTGVLISKKNTVAAYRKASLEDQVPAGNMLVAASVAMEGDNLFYKLAYDNYSDKTDLGFYWGAADGAAFSVKAGGAYLAVPKGADVKGFRLDGGHATGIDHVAEQDQKAIYNLNGQRVQKLQRGINIVNGRKVIF